MEGNKLTQKKRLDLKKLQDQIFEAALEIQKSIGMGFSADGYHKALAREMKLRNIDYLGNKEVLLPYKGEIADRFVLDFIVENKLLLMIKRRDDDDADEVRLRKLLEQLGLNLAMTVNFRHSKVEIRSVFN